MCQCTIYINFAASFAESVAANFSGSGAVCRILSVLNLTQPQQQAARNHRGTFQFFLANNPKFAQY